MFEDPFLPKVKKSQKTVGKKDWRKFIQLFWPVFFHSRCFSRGPKFRPAFLCFEVSNLRKSFGRWNFVSEKNSVSVKVSSWTTMTWKKIV